MQGLFLPHTDAAARRSSETARSVRAKREAGPASPRLDTGPLQGGCPLPPTPGREKLHPKCAFEHPPPRPTSDIGPSVPIVCAACAVYAAPMARHLAVFPGSFDPISFGHLDVVRRGRHLFDELVVAVGHNPGKAQLFTLEERVEMAQTLTDEIVAADPDAAPVRVASFSGLTVDYAASVGAAALSPPSAKTSRRSIRWSPPSSSRCSGRRRTPGTRCSRSFSSIPTSRRSARCIDLPRPYHPPSWMYALSLSARSRNTRCATPPGASVPGTRPPRSCARATRWS